MLLLLKPEEPRARAQQQEKPPQREALRTAAVWSPLCTTREKPERNEDPAQPKGKFNLKKQQKYIHMHTHILYGLRFMPVLLYRGANLPLIIIIIMPQLSGSQFPDQGLTPHP